ncbi:hypothetical protein PENSPDRAFT_343120 [Peniophora sp. CONT]|nr:hypothetical protein PENSPDRAFT_343120 [Peniophora sp. CONT]
MWTESRYKSARGIHRPLLFTHTFRLPFTSRKPSTYYYSPNLPLAPHTTRTAMDTFVTLLASFFESAPRDGPTPPVPTTNSTHNNPLETLQAGCIVA